MIKFCSNCGAPTKKENDTKFTCTGCGREHYVNQAACVAGILYTDNEHIMLAVRAHEPHKGMLDTLGGFVDVGENFEQALYRELHEEAGLTKDDITDVRYVGSSSEVYPWQGYDLPLASVFFAAKLKPGVTIAPNDDVAAVKTYKVGDIPIDQVAFEGMKDILSNL